MARLDGTTGSIRGGCDLIVDEDPLFRLRGRRGARRRVTGSSSSSARQQMAEPLSGRQIYHAA